MNLWNEYDMVADNDDNIMPNLIISHLNIRSLLNKHDDLKEYILTQSFDIFSLSETWLTDNISDFMINIPGYTIYRQDRINGRGGGVAIYVRNTANITNIEIISQGSLDIEFLWISAKINKNKVCIGCVYRPPNVNYKCLQLLEDLLADSLISSDYIFCLGDFNINFLNTSSAEYKFLDNILQGFSLEQLVKNATRSADGSSTLIDLILTNKLNIIINTGTINLPQFSDHHLVFCLVDMPMVRKNNSHWVLSRDIKNINLREFDVTARRLNWNRLQYFESIDEKVSYLESKITTLFNIHAPIRKIRVTKKYNPWITPNIKRMMVIRDRALSDYKKLLKNIHATNVQTKTKFEFYKEMRNFVTASIRREKKAYIENILNTNINNSRILWNNLDKLNICSKNRNNEIPPELRDPDAINNFFITTVTRSPADVDTVKYFNENKHQNVEENLIFTMVTAEEVRKVVYEISTNVKGVDGISSEMLKMSLPYCCDALTHIVNFSLMHSVVPERWKHALITPIPKKDKISTLNELRPISILPAMSKVIEKIVYARLKTHIDHYNILPINQSGFRPNHSTSTALLDVVDDMLRAVDKCKVTISIMLDYSKAFDSIDHSLLVAKLKYYGLSNNALDWFKHYLYNRLQQVQISTEEGKIFSDTAQITTGVPQGSILGPLLFIIYTSDIIQEIKSKVHCYADDQQLYWSFAPDEFHLSFQQLNNDLENINKWSNKNALCLNPTKTAAMLIGSVKQREKLNVENKLLLNNTPIIFYNNCKNLGLTIDSNLNFTLHVTNVLKIAYARLKTLYKFKYVVNTAVKLKLTESLILSLFDYCDVVYGPCLSVYDAQRIQVLQNACMRFACNVKRRDHITPTYEKYCWNKMEIRRNIHYSCIVRKIIKTGNPQYLRLKLVFGEEIHNRNMRNVHLLHVPQHSTSLFQGSFSFYSSFIYNQIPSSIKNIISYKTYKKEVKEYFSTHYH